MKAYKGFNRDMTCRGFQYEEGKSYHEDEAVLCKKGFHACLSPLDVLYYYAPATSVYHEVILDNVADTDIYGSIDDTKVAGKDITIGKRYSPIDIGLLQYNYLTERYPNREVRVERNSEIPNKYTRNTVLFLSQGATAKNLRNCVVTAESFSSIEAYKSAIYADHKNVLDVDGQNFIHVGSENTLDVYDSSIISVRSNNTLKAGMGNIIMSNDNNNISVIAGNRIHCRNGNSIHSTNNEFVDCENNNMIFMEDGIINADNSNFIHMVSSADIEQASLVTCKNDNDIRGNIRMLIEAQMNNIIEINPYKYSRINAGPGSKLFLPTAEFTFCDEENVEEGKLRFDTWYETDGNGNVSRISIPQHIEELIRTVKGERDDRARTN